MGKQIIKQPNGKYCIYSSSIDNVTHYNMEAKHIINEWIEEAKSEIEDRVKDIIKQLDEGGNPYFQFTLDFNEMIENIGLIHGEEEAKKVKGAIGK